MLGDRPSGLGRASRGCPAREEPVVVASRGEAVKRFAPLFSRPGDEANLRPMVLKVSKVRVLLGGSLLFAISACGGNKHKVLTPEERLAEQMAIADEQESNPSRGRWEDSEADSEKAAKFDPEFADHQLRRATLNAVDCPNTLPDDQKKQFKAGTARVQVIFQTDGTVKEVVLDSAYADTAVGACILRAYEPVQIKPYTGSDETKELEIELKVMTEKEKKAAKEKAAKEAAAKEGGEN